MENFSRLFDEEILLITTENGECFELPKHLLRGDDYFTSAYHFHQTVKSSGAILVPGINGDVLRQVINHLSYLEIAFDNAAELLYAANFLQIETLEEKLCSEVRSYVNLHNCLSLYALACKLNLIEMQKHISTFIRICFGITIDEKFDFSFNVLNELIAKATIDIHSGLSVLRKLNIPFKQKLIRIQLVVNSEVIPSTIRVKNSNASYELNCRGTLICFSKKVFISDFFNMYSFDLHKWKLEVQELKEISDLILCRYPYAFVHKQPELELYMYRSSTWEFRCRVGISYIFTTYNNDMYVIFKNVKNVLKFIRVEPDRCRLLPGPRAIQCFSLKPMLTVRNGYLFFLDMNCYGYYSEERFNFNLEEWDKFDMGSHLGYYAEQKKIELRKMQHRKIKIRTDDKIIIENVYRHCHTFFV